MAKPKVIHLPFPLHPEEKPPAFPRQTATAIRGAMAALLLTTAAKSEEKKEDNDGPRE